MAQAAHTAPGFDPRKIITAESFHVAPHLLGLPLASPWRRLAAILVDLLLVAVLSKSGKVFFALALAVAFLWIAGKKLGKGGGFFSRSVRVGLRGFGALFFFIAALSVWNSARRSVDRAVEDEGGGAARPAAMSVNGGQQQRQQKPTVMSAVRVGTAVAVLERADDSASARRAALNAARQLRLLNLTDAQVREALLDQSKERPENVQAGVRAALAVLDSTRAANDSAAADTAAGDSTTVDSATLAARAEAAAVAAGPDSLAALYVSTVHRGDTARAERLRPKLASVLARDSLDELRGQVGELREDKQELEREKEKAENRGLLSILLEWLDDLGIGIGWTGLYFTAFTALWKGQTPGKKLFGIRVLRLDGLPMTLWASFERFGGYAAGLFTGLTGYLQVFWDRNRQAIQDKISETVVIRERRGIPVPAAPPPGRPAPPRWPPAGVGAP
ncbi:MAG TPA: RDD family protein [Longimicrobiaceae bacterium]